MIQVMNSIKLIFLKKNYEIKLILNNEINFIFFIKNKKKNLWKGTSKNMATTLGSAYPNSKVAKCVAHYLFIFW